MNKTLDRVKGLLFERQGTLTSELLRRPAGFGLGQLPTRLLPDATTTTVCGFCSTGCGLDVHLKDGEGINLTPSKNYSVNLGLACPKGWEALTPLRAKDRARYPLLKDESGNLRRIDWATALETFSRRVRAIQAKHGPESVAFISTGQIPTEEMAFLGTLAKFSLGMAHGDGNTRQCMATAVVAYKQAFGFDAPPYTYADFEESDVIVLVGSNLCIAHPILWERVARNKNSPEIVVIDPRRTETAMAATQHLPIAPKSDLVFFYGLARLLIEKGAVAEDFVREHTEGFEAFALHLKEFDLERTCRESGIRPEALEKLAETIKNGKRVSFWWTMGVNQSHEGVRVAQAIIDIALLTGNVGRPGTGANSITGQCNAMGSRLFSNTTGLVGGHDFLNAEHRAKIAALLGIDVETIPKKNSLAYDQILEGIHRGTIKGLWVIATNTAHSWINQRDARELLDKLDFLVVQDMFESSETAKMADLVLPAAGWGEKEGTFINSERRFGLLKKVSRAHGEALADFYVFKLVAEAMGHGDTFRSWNSPEDVFQFMKAASRGQPCDITGIRDYAHLETARGIQWPLPEGEEVSTRSERRLFADGRFFHENGRARFLFEAPRPLPETTNETYPLVLLTGRGTSAQWHTQTRTSKSEVLRKLYSEDPYVEVNPKDARERGIHPGQWVLVVSRRGRMKAKAYITPIVQPGQIFVPMHYEKTNQLTFPAVDPYSRQPSYKHCAVRLETDLRDYADST